MTKTYVPCNKAYSEKTIQKFGSAVADEKGRKIGVIVETFTCTATERTDGLDSGWVCEPSFMGVNYGVRIQKTKNGERWGASQPTKFFKSEAEAKAHWTDNLAARIAKGWK